MQKPPGVSVGVSLKSSFALRVDGFEHTVIQRG